MSQKSCLVVDDEPAIREYLKAVLRKIEFQTHEAQTAPEAYRLLQKLNGQVDLIVTDIRMPGDMDGVDLAHAVRNIYPAMPFILISGYDTQPAAYPTRNCEFVRKPFTPEVILAAINRVTSRIRTAAG